MCAAHPSSRRFSLNTSHFTFDIHDNDDLVDLLSLAGDFPCFRGAGAGYAWQPQGGKARYTALPLRQAEIQKSPFQDIHGQGSEVRISTRSSPENPCDLVWIWRLYDGQPFALLRLEATNKGSQSLSMQALIILDCGFTNRGATQVNSDGAPPSFFKTGWHDWVYSGLRRPTDRDVNTLLGYFVGKMLFNPAVPICKRKGVFWGDGWGILAGRERVIVAGLVSTADQFGIMHVHCRSDRPALSLAAQTDGIPLEPQETLRSEWGYVEFVDLPCFDPAAGYAAAVARQMNPRRQAAPPPAKWTHWYHYFQSITEELFLANLEEIDKVRAAIPFRTVQLDDGYQSAWGDWDTTNAKFPHGLGHLADQIRAKGYTAGLWLAPFVADPRSKIAQQHPDWLVKDARCKSICSGYFYQFFGHALDVSHPGVQEHLYRLMDKIAHEWGFGFVKTDFTYAGALPGKRYDRRLTRAQVFRRGMEIIRKGIGEETFLLGCGCPFGPAIGLVDAMRVGPDTAPNWNPFLWSVPWSAPLLRKERSIASLRNNMRHTLNLSAIHKRWWWNDPDCLMVRDYDTKLSQDEVISNVTLTGLSGGLLIHSDDLTRLNPARRHLISLLTPILSQDARPLDLLEHEMAEIYDLPMTEKWGKWHVTAVFNWEDAPRRKSLDLARLGFRSGQRLHVFDFWQEAYHFVEGQHLDLGILPAHACRLLRTCAEESSPQIAGSTLHITQGGEVDGIHDDSSKIKIGLRDLGRQVEGSLWIWTPDPIDRACLQGHEVKVNQVGAGVSRIPLDYSGASTLEIG